MTDLPAVLTYATFTGWFTQSVADGVDLNREPDMGPMQGSVTFAPNVSPKGVVVDSFPQPMTLFLKPIPCIVDDEGYLLGGDLTRDLVVIATGALIPSYTVTFAFDGQLPYTKIVLAPAGTIVDLPTAPEVPVTGAPEGIALRGDNLVVAQGTTWEIRWPIVDAVGTPAVLTGWDVRAQARASVGSVAVLHQWSATDGNASIIESSVSLRMSPEVSSALTWTTAVFDVELFNIADGRVARVSQGTIRIDGEVTQ